MTRILRTEIVKAYIVLKPRVAPSESLATEIGSFVKSRLAAHEYPREIAFVEELPLTTTGKIIRRTLRERAAGELAEAPREATKAVIGMHSRVGGLN